MVRGEARVGWGTVLGGNARRWFGNTGDCAAGVCRQVCGCRIPHFEDKNMHEREVWRVTDKRGRGASLRMRALIDRAKLVNSMGSGSVTRRN